jgi:LysM repeat protein
METITRNTPGSEAVRQVMFNVTVVLGDTLSEIAAEHGTTWQVLAADNPQIKDPNLIFPGEQVMVPVGGSYSSWTPGSSPSPSTQPSPSSTVSTAGSYSGSGLGDVPGVPVAFATCVAQKESSDNPTAVNSVPGYIGNGGGAYGFLESTWNNYGGYRQPFQAPVSVQKAAFSALYKTNSGYPWVADGCPQALLGEK